MLTIYQDDLAGKAVPVMLILIIALGVFFGLLLWQGRGLIGLLLLLVGGLVLLGLYGPTVTP